MRLAQSNTINSCFGERSENPSRLRITKILPTENRHRNARDKAQSILRSIQNADLVVNHSNGIHLCLYLPDELARSDYQRCRIAERPWYFAVLDRSNAKTSAT